MKLLESLIKNTTILKALLKKRFKKPFSNGRFFKRPFLKILLKKPFSNGRFTVFSKGRFQNSFKKADSKTAFKNRSTLLNS